MAWCPSCNKDRPITRQTFTANCPHCGSLETEQHIIECRGPVPGSLDVCTFCNKPIFAKASNEDDYNNLKKNESIEGAKALEEREKQREKAQNANTFVGIGCLLFFLFFISGGCKALFELGK